ncbi:hypothetical protein [Pleomorphovibrio marinus]|uniref:hypothetical protein n=1 Tax=Pleomorphovibrio marinus TaxID=2164132 RepID=UPI003743A7A3
MAHCLNPIVRGLLNYHHKLRGEAMREVCNPFIHRLLKWEKGLYKMAAVRWLKHQYKVSLGLFEHWNWFNLRYIRTERFIILSAEQEGIKRPSRG